MPEKFIYRQHYFGPRSLPAETVGSELERIRTEGDLTAPRVVEAAEPEDAPLHPVFEWDDSEAAREFRLIQARQLIRAVIVVPDEGPSRSAYIHVPPADSQEPEGKYVPLMLVTEKDDEYQRALGEASRFLASAEQRYRELKRLTEGRQDRAAALAIALEGFSAVREAVALLKAAA